MAQKTWFYNEKSGRIIHEGNTLLAAVQEQLPLWHAFNTKAEAEAYKAAHPPSWPILGQAADAAGSAVTAGVKGVDVGGFLSALANPNTWLRVGEVALGLILIAVGLAKMTSAIPAVNKIARLAI
jgi:hypothetical protein